MRISGNPLRAMNETTDFDIGKDIVVGWAVFLPSALKVKMVGKVFAHPTYILWFAIENHPWIHQNQSFVNLK